MRFIQDGRIRTFLNTGRPPWGITFGPCGQFALIKRVHGNADEIDHEAAAGYLKDGA